MEGSYDTTMRLIERAQPIADAGLGENVLRLFGIAAAAFVLVVALFASVARVDSGHVGVLTLFGRVTGIGAVACGDGSKPQQYRGFCRESS